MYTPQVGLNWVCVFFFCYYTTCHKPTRPQIRWERLEVIEFKKKKKIHGKGKHKIHIEPKKHKIHVIFFVNIYTCT